MMRSLVFVGILAALAGCNAVDPSTPTKVSWKYGAGNGDGVAYPGPAPVFQRAYGWGADQVATPLGKPDVNYAYGADGNTGNIVQVAPQPSPQLAAPAPMPDPAPTAPQRAAAPGTHS